MYTSLMTIIQRNRYKNISLSSNQGRNMVVITIFGSLVLVTEFRTLRLTPLLRLWLSTMVGAKGSAIIIL